MEEKNIPAALLDKWQKEAEAEYPDVENSDAFTYEQYLYAQKQRRAERKAYLTACRKRWEEHQGELQKARSDAWDAAIKFEGEEYGYYEYNFSLPKDHKNKEQYLQLFNIPTPPKTEPATETGENNSKTKGGE